MKYLLIGSGGREHAIIKALCLHKNNNNNNNDVSCISTTTNPKIVELATNYFLVDKIENLNVVNICNTYVIDMVIIGSETYLNSKLPDILYENNIACFGPYYQYAMIELDKAFLRGLLPAKYNPEYYVFESYEETNIIQALKNLNEQYVIKYSGIWGGKGVKIAGEHLKNISDALNFCKEILSNNHKIIIEEKLIGMEFSYHSFCDGVTLRHTIPIHDYKRLYNHDCGPNTGSMGAVSCANHKLPFLTDSDILEAKQINEKVLANLYKSVMVEYGISAKLQQGYKGVMYGSFIKTSTGLKVIEYNSRFGDPEAINLMKLMTTDFASVLEAIKNQTLNNMTISFKNEYSLTKYVVPEGYPNKPVKNKELCFHRSYDEDLIVLSNIEQINVDPTTNTNTNKYILKGSRALAYINSSPQLRFLIDESEQLLKYISGPVYYRNDIGCDITTPDILDYQSSGVDVENANNIVTNIGELIASTLNENCINEVGDYSGIIDVKNTSYKNPVLITSMDGVGTKTLFVNQLATHNPEFSREELYKNLGRDIIGHSINDILVKGAQPLFFTDYIAAAKLDKAAILSIVSGMTEQARAHALPIVGGETAEMPGVYSDNSYDIVGNIVGIAERTEVIDGKKRIRKGDVCIGLPSVSPHTNGYSLIRKIFEVCDYSMEKLKIRYGVDSKFVEWLCRPHKSYYRDIMPLIQKRISIHGLVHVTGGGFTDNIPRVLPDSLAVVLDKSMLMNDNFKKLKFMTNTTDEDMYKTFNCGIGFIVITDEDSATLITRLFEAKGIEFSKIGVVCDRNFDSQEQNQVVFV